LQDGIFNAKPAPDYHAIVIHSCSGWVGVSWPIRNNANRGEELLIMNILYLCTGNSCRSQMAEAWTRALHKNIKCWSAGVVKHGMNENAIRVMTEAGVDMSEQYSKTVDELPDVHFDYVVTLCGHAAENCPYFSSGSNRVHRGFEDPPSETRGLESEEEILAVYRRVRDEIRAMVEKLPQSLEN